MENSYIAIFERRFLVQGLPTHHRPSEPHLQIFDNYPPGSDLRLRKIRIPETNERQYLLEKNYAPSENTRMRRFARIILTENEYSLLDALRGNETRKNRYSIDDEGLNYSIDIYLGKLWGLNVATLRSEIESEIDLLTLPQLSLMEITGDNYFEGKNLADLELNDIRAYLKNKKGGANGASLKKQS